MTMTTMITSFSESSCCTCKQSQYWWSVVTGSVAREPP